MRYTLQRSEDIIVIIHLALRPLVSMPITFEHMSIYEACMAHKGKSAISRKVVENGIPLEAFTAPIDIFHPAGRTKISARKLTITRRAGKS
jgi:hypothetical protein